ncbi:unnamed protein product [Rotaria sordida]|uniref:Peptidase metallopeptidase domain-containing protein n=1 Tax=Rotaria sordida TaxID=392033 RepID=A0A814BLL7_9BILA|nr:unnamed protein product [Rotaria sordida]CAF0954443.1 unnamed protein product [Rotaria sordida]
MRMKQIICICTKSAPNYNQYLEQFGYTQSDHTSKLESRLFSPSGKPSANEGIKKFQRLFKLPETGILDEQTKKLMQRPRCGNPDIGILNVKKQSSNDGKLKPLLLNQGRLTNMNTAESYVTHEKSWPIKHLKWFIEEYPKQQKHITSQDDIRRIINQAFHDWEKYSGLTFEMAKTKETANFNIKFSSKDHNDGYPFDGQGITLAHAFYPKSGDIHFDDDEYFTDDYTNQNDQYTLRLVAAHEIGHALGLSHSFAEDSLMFPVYQQFNSDYSISKDDQDGIQSLYGKSDEKITTTTTTKTTLSPMTSTRSPDILPMNNWCSGDFQTGCEGPDGDLYLFKNTHLWRYRARTKQGWDPQPTLISQRFPHLKDKTITACVKSVTGYVYFFHNYDLWKARTHWSMEGPHRLRGKNYPQNSHVALFHNNSIYLLQNDIAYSLNEFNYNRELGIHPITTILDSPPKESIHSGFTYGERHYIFTRNHVYVYNSIYGNLLDGYPKSLTNGWFACDPTLQIQKLNKKTTKEYNRNNERDNYHDRHRHHDHDHNRHYGRRRLFPPNHHGDRHQRPWND